MNKQPPLLYNLARTGSAINTTVHPWRISDGKSYKFFSERGIAMSTLLHDGWTHMDVLGMDGRWIPVHWRMDGMVGG